MVGNQRYRQEISENNTVVVLAPFRSCLVHFAHFLLFAMSSIANSLFPILDYCARGLVPWVCLLLPLAAFIGFCISSDKDRHYARIARYSSVTSLCLFPLYILYFILNPAVSSALILANFSYISLACAFNISPFLWLVYGENAIAESVKGFRSRRLEYEERIRSTRVRMLVRVANYFFVAITSLAMGPMLIERVAAYIVSEWATGDSATLSTLFMSVLLWTVIVFAARLGNSDIKRFIADKHSIKNGTEITIATYKGEKEIK